MHPIVTTISDTLEKNNIPYTRMEHAAGVTSEEMVAIRKDFSLAEGAKALIVSIDNDKFIQIVVPGDRKFSNTKLKKITGAKNIRFAGKEELADITNGVLAGAVPPFGNLFGLPVYADIHIFDNERMVFNCGERTISITMNPQDYKSVVNPIVADIT